MSRPKSTNIQKKLIAFQQNPQQQKRFEKLVLKLPLTFILWPRYHAASFYREFSGEFSREFCIKIKGSYCVFPLEPLGARVHYASMKLEELARMQYEELHPSLAYLMLSNFERQLEDLRKSAKIKNTKMWRLICQQLKKQKKSLDVSQALRKSKNYSDICAQFLSEFQNMSQSYAKILKRKEVAETELAAFRLELDRKQKQEADTESLQEYKRNLRLSLEKERKMVARLEKELRRVTEQILSFHHLDQNSSLLEEYQNLRQEYDLLTRKNDALVSKNIELANRIERTSHIHAYKLEEILDMIQKRINVLLRKEYSEDQSILLRSIEKEILELNRARAYLGRALYNLGLLYMRMGDTANALKELRAARELGIRDSKAERLIASLSST